MVKLIARYFALKSVLMGILIACSSCIYAAGFQLFEQNGSGVGDYDAGGAAEAQDASIAWYNPAGLVMLDHVQLVLGMVGINVGVNFQGDVQNYATTLIPGLHIPKHPPPPPTTVELLGSDEFGQAQGGEFIPVPDLHLAVPLGNRIVAGLSVVVPFGLETDWPDDSVVRYAGTDTSIVDIDITPTLAVKITNKLSLGGGIDFQHVLTTINGVVGLGDIKPFNTDSISSNEGDEWVTGWHAGVLYQFTPQTRVGFAYHSQVDVNTKGTSQLTGPLVLLATNPITDTYGVDDLTTDFTLPAFMTLSIFHQINDRWAVKGSVNYTEWHVFDNIPLYNVAGVTQVGATPNFQTAVLDISAPQNFRNTIRVAVGINFQQTERWMWRAGLGFDQDPTNDTDRTVRLPEGNIFAAAIGARFQALKQLNFDVGYQHLFAAPGEINNLSVVGAQETYVEGTTKNQGDLFALQMTWNII